jgi:flagellar basal body-associated protein FliL
MNDQSTDTSTDEKAPSQEKQGSNTLTIVLAVLLVLALAAVAFLLINNGTGEDSGSGEGSGDEIFQPTAAPEEPVDLPLEGTQKEPQSPWSSVATRSPASRAATTTTPLIDRPGQPDHQTTSQLARSVAGKPCAMRRS